MTHRRRRRGAGRAEPACEDIRQAVSARLDGEPTGLKRETVDVHLAGCPDCLRFQAGLSTLSRQVGLQMSRPAPDALKEVLTAHLALTVGPAPHIPPRRPREVRTNLSWRRSVQWISALTPAALVAVFVPLGALSSPHETPSHAPTPCTAFFHPHPVSARH
jgi:predicted anti-sigma-YlaC factor YlaD